jgi:hypothetical protein
MIGDRTSSSIEALTSPFACDCAEGQNLSSIAADEVGGITTVRPEAKRLPTATDRLASSRGRAPVEMVDLQNLGGHA